MIKSKEDYRYYLEADRIALSLPKKRSAFGRIKNILFPNPIWEFQKILRKLEYYKNCRNRGTGILIRYFITKKYNRYSVKLGFTIPVNVFGPGLSIAHHGTIVINGGARIGANCCLHACVNVGTEAGSSGKAPIIGDNCYIGPGVKIFGTIKIANGTAIGANSVVNKSFVEENTAIAGVPAKKIGKVNTTNFLIPATTIMELGLNKTQEITGIPAKELKKLLGY